MAYTKTNWQDLPNTTTPINASNLNNMEQGIYDLDTAVTNLQTDVSLSVNSNLTSGTITAKRVGKLVIVNISGSLSVPNTWTAYTLCTITGVLSKDDTISTVVDQGTGLCADIVIPANSNVISLNKRNASNITGGWFRGQIIFVAQ